MNLIRGLCEELAEAGLRLRKAQPRGPGRLTMELDTADGRVCAGQWYADDQQTPGAATALRDRFGKASVQVLDNGHLMVQHGGADRRLAALWGVMSAPGAALVAHRVERRAVVRLAAGQYVKVLRPGHARAVTTPLRHLRAGPVQVPRVLGVDDRRGVVTLSAIAGSTLSERLVDATVTDEHVLTDAQRVGVAVRVLHESPPLLGAPDDPLAEVTNAHRWLAEASAYRLLDADRWEPLLKLVATRLTGSRVEQRLVHRDLHDKQVILTDDTSVGLLDLDLARPGDPALDLANLVVHLRLRALQRGCSARRGSACGAAFLDGYSPDAAVLHRMAPYADATRLRLAGIYSFRDSPAGLVEHLLADVGREVVVPAD